MTNETTKGGMNPNKQNPQQKPGQGQGQGQGQRQGGFGGGATKTQGGNYTSNK